MVAQQDGVLVTTCAVDFGSSGAPIFTVADGKAQIVSVVSAKAQIDTGKVSLGTSLGMPLALLQAELVAGKGVYQEAGPAASRVKATSCVARDRPVECDDIGRPARHPPAPCVQAALAKG